MSTTDLPESDDLAEQLRRIRAGDLSNLGDQALPTNTSPDPQLPEPAIPVPREYLVEEPIRPCPHCGDAGWYKEAVAFGHPHFGMLFPCVCRQRQNERRRFADLLGRSNLGAVRYKTFMNFDRNVPGVQQAFNAALAYSKRPRGWLVLLGGYGAGKTHLAAAIGNVAVDSGMATYFAILGDLLDQLKSTFGAGSDVRFDALFTQVREVPLLIIDDLGAEKSTEWAQETVFKIIDFRYARGIPTVITSNRPKEAIEPRVLSRIAGGGIDGQLLRLTAKDYRLRGQDIDRIWDVS